VRVVARGVSFGFGLSPDGRRIVYALAPHETGQGECGDATDLYTADLRRGSSTRLTHDGRSAYPIWGPDRIAFMRVSVGDCLASGIWTLRPDGSDIRAIVARAPRTFSRNGYYGLQPVVWLPGGRLLVGVRTEWGNEAAVLEPSTSRIRRIGQYVDEVSRDSRFILGSQDGERTTLAIVRIADGRQTFVTRGYLCCPDWNR